MEIFLRIVSYSNNVGRRFAFFFFYSTLGTIFGALNIVFAMPMFDILFGQGKGPVVVPEVPAFELSEDYFITLFNHFYTTVIRDYGNTYALLFICGLIVVCRLLGNIFVYLERVIATKIRVDLVKNLRVAVFKNVTTMQIGYFNEARRGDLISRFTNDVNEMENGVMNSLKAVLKEPIAIVVYFVLLFTISVKLTLFTLIALPLMGGALA